MDLEARLKLITRNTEEIITENELKVLLETETNPKAYCGFEPSGLMHLGTGMSTGLKILDIVNAGFEFTIFLADWHAWINNKLGGDINKIKLAGEYFKQGFTAIGLTPERVKYVWASELVKKSEYWEKVIKIAKKASVSRVTRCLPIMGRELSTADIDVASLFYPCMQVADIFELDVDCACAGLDQRKAHMLARDTAEKLGFKKPVCVHTHLLLGLAGTAEKMGGQFDEDASLNLQISAKMSKSIPKSCIYIHDTPSEIRDKIMSAYCPPKQVKGNPILEIVKYIIFNKEKSLRIDRSRKYGGPIEFSSYEELEKNFAEGSLHPLDLKNSVAEMLIKLLEPIRSYFKNHPEILNEMKRLEVTR
jgi:tyrosyl-tRNA synthetase